MRHGLLLLILFSLVGCKRETRIVKLDPAASATVGLPHSDTVWPGPTSNEIVTNFSFTNVAITNWAPKNAAPNAAHRRLEDFYEKNGWSMSEGKRLFAAFNCVGCHGHGGGGMGPALMDQKWIYGSTPEEIFNSIALGRTNGMPAFKDRLPEYVIWEMVAYVRSMSGLAPIDAAPQRDDHLQTRLPENTIGAAQPGGKP
jgi:cytochrome c oxidase cbb3-type subunit 3